MIFKTKIMCLAAFFCGTLTYAQTFTNMTSLLNSPAGGKNCVVDMNSDGLDDIVTVSGANLVIDYQQTDGSFSETVYSVGLQNSPSWSICAGDIDGNGYNDLMFGGGSRVSFIYANADGTAYTEDYTPYETGVDDPYIFAQRTNLVDIDNDGNLDAFSCHDVDLNHPYRNDGNGNLTEDQSLLPTIDITGNYASIFVDFDNDGDTDMYMTKCSGGNPAGHAANQNGLYVNDGNGNFTVDGPATASTYGLFDGDKSWVTVFEDFDNDGDFDAYTVNHSNQNFLRENDGTGHYSDVTTGSGINESDLGSWGCIGADLDNDGFIDILSDSGTGDEYYHNDGTSGLTFTGSSLPFDPQNMALGDLNNDGFIDAWSGSQLYMNDGNANNWTKICLEGVASNRNGIGARIEINGSWGTQIRECRSGEGFHPGNSLDVNFGLGTATAIDNITVKWPSGQVDVITAPAINTRIVIVEGAATPGFENVSISLKAFLGGAYSSGTGEMNDVLRTSGSIPTAEPFTAKGFNHVGAGGTETISAPVLIPADATAIVDWVFVEIRDGNDPTTVLATKSALIRKNGFLCDVNGNNNMIFALPETGNFCVALRHPNHLGFRNTTVTNNDPGTDHFFDMSNGSEALYGTDALWDAG
ncbi:MAG: hypothetical protein ACI9EV_002401, partial [Urechidicola sp.]